MGIEEVKISASEYVELEADTEVKSIEVVEHFTHFADDIYVLSAETTDDETAWWWVVAGDTPTNLYPKSQFDDPDYVFSFHEGLMSRMAERQIQEPEGPPEGEKYDVFICHASEDKDDFVRPLVRELNRRGHFVWYDESKLEVGDNLRKAIDEGLSNAYCGVVILSESFFNKDWTEYELNGLTAREIGGDYTVILPIWYQIGRENVLEYSPTLADKVAIQANGENIKNTADELSSAIKSRVREQMERYD